MKIKLLSADAKIPTRADKGAAGLDLYLPKTVTIKPGRQVVPLDFAMALDYGNEGQIRPRSGFSAKGIEGYPCSNAICKETKRYDADVLLGTIDCTYRGNVGAIIKSYEKEPFVVPAGTRIAQMVISECSMEGFEQVDELDETDRGEGGFGHTGSK